MTALVGASDSRLSLGHSAEDTLWLHNQAWFLGSPAIAAHCRLQIFLKSTALFHSSTDFTALSWIQAACFLKDAGFPVPSDVYAQILTRCAWYEHIERLPEQLQADTLRQLYSLSFQGKHCCLDANSADEDHLPQIHAAVGRDLVPLHRLTDKDVEVLLLAEQILKQTAFKSAVASNDRHPLAAYQSDSAFHIVQETLSLNNKNPECWWHGSRQGMIHSPRRCVHRMPCSARKVK